MKKLFLLPVVFFLFSCSYNSHITKGKVYLTKKAKVGILIFSNLSTYPNAEFLVTEALTSKLMQLPIEVADSGAVAKYYSDFRSVSYNDYFKIRKIAEKANLDYLITGYIEEFGYRQSIRGANEAPVVSMEIYVYDMNSIKPVFTGFYSSGDLKSSSGSKDYLIELLNGQVKCFLKDLYFR